MYLTAIAQVVMISKNNEDFYQAHPASNEKFPTHEEIRYARAGVYRMWVKFKIEEQVHTADFTQKVGEVPKIRSFLDKKNNTHS